jgi:hypothetical protein
VSKPDSRSPQSTSEAQDREAAPLSGRGRQIQAMELALGRLSRFRTNADFLKSF